VDFFAKKLLIPALCVGIVLVEVQEIETNLEDQVHKLLHVIDVQLELIDCEGFLHHVWFVLAQFAWSNQRWPKVLHLFRHKDDLHVFLALRSLTGGKLLLSIFKVLVVICNVALGPEARVWLS
jgi:hypothetical protein